MKIRREIEPIILAKMIPNKVIELVGARRVGKTQLMKKILADLEEPYLLLNGEDFSARELLQPMSVSHYEKILGNIRFLAIDEAQFIPDIGRILKLMIDSIDGLRIFITGSSALSIHYQTGEPLTGRKHGFMLFPFSETELRTYEKPTEAYEKLVSRLVFGNYPELTQMNRANDKADYLREIINSYLYKDILIFENLKNSDKIMNLLRLLAFQIGREVSYHELGRQLSMSKNTVEKYLELLSKTFVIFKINGYSRNLRKEIVKNPRWYFYDNGIRNALTANLNPVSLRSDVGQLWENYLISERVKHVSYQRKLVNTYFWRTYDQQEIDWIEERDNNIYAFEIKWADKKTKVPPAWKKAYPDSKTYVISRVNYKEWLVSDIGPEFDGE